MPARSKMLRNGTIRGQETLGVPWGFEPAHAPLALTRRLVGVFRPVVQIAMLAMFYPGQYLALGRTIAFELIGNNHPRHVG